jgi:soluble lytic murein transglycosylase-like protein
MSAPVYISRGSSQGIGELQPSRDNSAQITGQAQARFGQALGGLGNVAFSLGEQIQQINRASTVADRKTGFMTGIDNLGKEFENDPDPATAEQRFQEQVTKLEGSALEGLRADDAAELRVQLRRQSISYAGGVRANALKKQSDGYLANVDQQFDVLTRNYANAKTDTERQTFIAELDETLKSGVSRGMMTAKAAEAYRQSMAQTGDNALVLRQIGMNPAAAQAALADPESFKGLNPVQREQFAQQARSAAEALRTQRLEIRAKTDLEGAAIEAGRINPANTRLISQIFDRVIVPQESGGNTNAQSVDGAAGIGQIMPGTARGLAKMMGLDEDWQSMPDHEVQQRLKANPGLNRAMGIRLLQENAKRFDGSAPAMIAAYHAAPGQVEKAHQAAIAEFGEGYSAAQFISKLPDSLKDGNNKTTKSYVADIYKRMGVDVNAAGFTGMNSYRAGDMVEREWDRREAQTRQIVNEVTSLSRQQADQFGGLLDQGLNVNPARLAEIQSGLQLGAARGEPQAAETLRLLNERIEMLPHVQRAYRMAPADLEAYTSNLRSSFAQDPTPQKERQLKVFEAVAAQVAKGAKEAPVQLYERQTDGQPTFVNPQAQIGGVELAQQLQARSIVSDGAFKRYQSRAFFKPEEARAWKDRFETMGDQERFDLLQALQRNTTGEAAYRAAVAEVTGGDKLAATAGMFLTNNPQLARDILRGSSIAQLDGIKPKAEEIRNALKSTMPGLLYPSVAMQSDVIEAALAVYASERGRNAALYDAGDRAGLEAAIERVTGRIVKINGAKVPMPPDIRPAAAQEAIYNLSKEILDAFGGAYGRDNQPLDPLLIARHAQLRPLTVQGNLFAVLLPEGREGAPVMTRDGRPLVIDLAKAVQLQAPLRTPSAAGRVNRTLAEQFAEERRQLGIPMGGSE